MKVIQVSIDDELLAAVDVRLPSIGLARSAFIRRAVKHELERAITAELEAQHRRGYECLPVEPGEFDLQPDDERWPEW